MVSDVFVKYGDSWCHPNPAANYDDFSSLLVSSALTITGIKFTDENNSENNNGVSEVAVTSSGLRFETFAAFILLHLIGHKKFVPSVQIWKWAINAIVQQGGQPSQVIALAALSRLAYNDISIGSGHPSSLLNPLSTSFSWESLLKGISQCHQKSSDGEKS